jgi:hypothetical protein
VDIANNRIRICIYNPNLYKRQNEGNENMFFKNILWSNLFTFFLTKNKCVLSSYELQDFGCGNGDIGGDNVVVD